MSMHEEKYCRYEGFITFGFKHKKCEEKVASWPDTVF